MPTFGTGKRPADCKSFATVTRGVLLAAMAMLILIVPATAVKAQEVTGICDRTPEVQTAILAAIGSGTCSTVTDTQLASIVDLSISSYSASSIVSADFAGLTGLTSLRIDGSPQLTTVPANAFSRVATALARLDLENNSISTIDEDAFDGLTNLQDLNISNNNLTTLPADVFDGLTALRTIAVTGNSLTALDADIFDGLTALERLDINYNSLTELDADIFDGLTALERLDINYNSLTELDADIFDGLTALGWLYIGANSLTELDADIFDGLTALESLRINNSLTELDADIFDGLTALGSRLYHRCQQPHGPLDADIFDGLTALESLRHH